MALIQSFTRALVGGGDLTPYLINAGGGASAATWPLANQGIWCKFRVHRARTVTGLRIFVATASGNAKVGLYSSDGTTLTQQALSASTAVAGTNVPQDILFTASKVVTPFADWFAFVAMDNTVASILRLSWQSGGFSGVGALDLTYAVSSVFASPPATQSSFTNPSGGYSPVLGLI